ncbi:hypothetical protein [Phytopseudomonas flavescens]|uniref:hypothetical protein n=1 Tax=Phytopseudomonas flavescens TaxID=29435 RepID=UPI003B58AF69
MRAAEDGDPLAQYRRGLMLLRGSGIEADPAAGLKWIRCSAEGGYRIDRVG